MYLSGSSIMRCVSSGEIGELSHGADDHRPERQVGNEMAVHHVEVKEIRAGALGSPDLLSQSREIRGEKARRHRDRFVFSSRNPLPPAQSNRLP